MNLSVGQFLTAQQVKFVSIDKSRQGEQVVGDFILCSIDQLGATAAITAIVVGAHI